jgi:hypothetical protein
VLQSQRHRKQAQNYEDAVAKMQDIINLHSQPPNGPSQAKIKKVAGLYVPFPRIVICLMRIGRFGFGTGRQKMALERGTHRPHFVHPGDRSVRVHSASQRGGSLSVDSSSRMLTRARGCSQGEEGEPEETRREEEGKWQENRSPQQGQGRLLDYKGVLCQSNLPLMEL